MNKRNQYEWRKPSEHEQQGSIHYIGNGTDIQEHATQGVQNTQKKPLPEHFPV